MPRKILVVAPAWIGDLSMAQCLFIALRQAHEDTQIDVLAPAWSLPLTARMPEVNRGIVMPVGHGELGFNKLRKLGHTLRSERYDRAIVLPRKLKAALVPWFAKIPQRTGYRGEQRFGLINDMRKLDKGQLTQNAQRYAALASDEQTSVAPLIHLPRLNTNMVNRARLLREFGLTMDRPVVVLMPGAEYGPAKRWPPEYYGLLAADLEHHGRQVWILGSAPDIELGDAIRKISGHKAINLCGQTQLTDVVDLLSICEVAIGNDSGLMHVAAASGTRTIAFYGPTSPDFAPPLSERADILYLRLKCSPCNARKCPLGHHDCLRRIEPLQILKLALRPPEVTNIRVANSNKNLPF